MLEANSMKCYCYETETQLILCVENVAPEFEKNLVAAWFEKTDTGFTKIYPMTDKDNGVSAKDREIVKSNFARLGQSMFVGNLDWKNILPFLAKKFSESNIEWYIFGSVSDAVIGVDIVPHDMDIIVHTRDFYKVKDIFLDCVVEPFVDNKGTWLVRYFGRLGAGSAYIDVVADEKMNLENHPYDSVSWNGFNVFVEPFKNRYQLELMRNRPERIKAMEEYMKKSMLTK